MDKLEGVMSLIEDEDLEKIGTLYKIDKHNTKIMGSLLFKGLMRLILMGKRVSLRMLAKLLNQDPFCKLGDSKSVTFSGLSKRINALPAGYFKDIYEDLAHKADTIISRKRSERLHRFDSTVISLSGKLLKDGLQIGGKLTDCHIKATVGLKNSLPQNIRFCTTQREASEDIALVRAINEAKVDKEDILLFDQGITNSDTFSSFEKQGYKFITRVRVGRKHVVVSAHTGASTTKPTEEDPNILDDQIIKLFTGHKRTKTNETQLRLVKIQKADGGEIWFLTNMFDLSAAQVAESYKRRWDIEVFFKFIKQNLGYRHFISHSLSGMRVYIYMILITAIIFMLYKSKNALQGFKIPLLDFTLALEKSFMCAIIKLSGGSLKKVEHLL